MSLYAKILSLSYGSAVATKTTALKTHWRSVRLIKDAGAVNPKEPSYTTNVLLCGNCVDPENRNLYVFYIDTFYGSAWIIEINIDSRNQKVVYFDKYNAIGFDPLHKIYNPKVVHGKLVWTDDLNPIYQMDITRAKKSFALGIGYGQYPNTTEWNLSVTYGIDQIVSAGNGFYKSLVDNNIGHEPRVSPTQWEDLKCLIEDAYYSMNVENFYFEAMPPKLPPEVTYQADDARKINNLRQTLFQIAYLYVYMDWRKSTISPASIVQVPQAEEETATGLANELVSLNNKLQIVVNSGGEEVRAIEIIGRSSQDPSKWFLIETINKFEEQERSFEISRITEPDYNLIGITIPQPTVISAGEVNSAGINCSMNILQPTVINSQLNVTYPPEMFWQHNEQGAGVFQNTEIDCPLGKATITAKPDWIVIHLDGDDPGVNFPVGWELSNLDIIAVYPNSLNGGIARIGYIILSDAYGDTVTITVGQLAAPPPVPIVCTVEVDPDDTSGLVISDSEATAMSSDEEISMDITVTNPGYAAGVLIPLSWRIEVDGVRRENGSFTNVYNGINILELIPLESALVAGEVVVIYLSSEGTLSLKTNAPYKILGLSVPSPNVRNSYVVVSDDEMTWLAVEQGVGVLQNSTITCSPNSVFITSKPDWITIRYDGADPLTSLPAGSEIFNGDVLAICPNAINEGSAKNGTILFTNIYGETASIAVNHQAALAPPSGDPIYCTVEEKDIPGNDLTILYPESTSAVGESGTKRIEMDVSVQDDNYGYFEEFTVNWEGYVNGSQQGSGSVLMNNGTSNLVTLVMNNNLLVGDVVVIYLFS